MRPVYIVAPETWDAVESDSVPRIIVLVIEFAFPMQVAKRSVASRTDGVAELKRQLDMADADIALVNKRLNESQGRWLLRSHLVRELMPVPYN